MGVGGVVLNIIIYLSIISFIFLVSIIFILRNIFMSNLKKAENYHRKSLNFAEKNDYKKAKLYSEISKIYREKTNN